MAAIEELTSELVSRGMDPGAAAAMVARAMLEAATPKRSKEAERALRYRQRQKERDESVTRHDGFKRNERDESVTNRDDDRVPLSSKKDIGRTSPSRVTRKRCSLPVGFLLSEKMRAYALSKGLDPPRITREFEKFCDHHRAKGSLFADWEAAWRTWVGHSIEFARKNGGGQGGAYRWNGGIEGVT